MSRPSCGATAFTEHIHSKSPDLCTLIDSNFIGGFAGSLSDRQTGLNPDPNGADNLHVGDCTPQLEFDAASSIATTGRIPISEDLHAASSKGNFQPDNRNDSEKYNDSDDDEWFLVVI